MALALSLQKPHAEQAILFLYHARSSPSPGLFHMSNVSESRNCPRGRGEGEGEDGQEQSPPYLCAGRQRHRLPEGTKKQFLSRGEELMVPWDKTIKLVYQRQVRRYGGTWIFARRRLAMPGRRRRHGGAKCLSTDGMVTLSREPRDAVKDLWPRLLAHFERPQSKSHQTIK